MCCGCSLDCSFWTSRDGILKTIEFIFSLLIVILTSASSYDTRYIYGERELKTQQMAAVNFVGAFCCITLLISAAIYVLTLYNMPLCGRLPWKNMEMLYKLVCAVLNLIGMSVAANSAIDTADVRANTFPDFYELYTTVAIFSAIVLVIFLVHFLLYFRGGPPVSEKQPRSESNVPV